MSEALALLLDLLDLERIEVNTFRGRHPEEERQRTFGGQVAAQALMAAGRTVEVGAVHSLHS
jgi:acyl-CoA thioesterase-2